MPATEGAPDLTLRQARVEDLPQVARIHLEARAAAEAAGWFPPSVHPPEEARAWVGGWDLTEQQVWLAEFAGDAHPVGYARFTETWLDDLYVVPAAQQRGVGTALLALVQALRPSGFGLWVFESNTPAQDFYAKHGFVVTRRTDGADNEERAPDRAMAWPEPDPRAATTAAYDADAAAYASGLLDRTDEMLADLTSFVAAVGPAARVLEIGSGSGRDALALEGAGVHVERTDITPGFVAMLHTSGHAARLLDPLTDDLTAADGMPWDGVWAQASLLHVARADLGVVLARLADVVRPEGVLFCSLKEGDGEAWSAHGHVAAARHFTYWREEALRAVLAEAGWSVRHLRRDTGHPSGRGWFAVLAARR